MFAGLPPPHAGALRSTPSQVMIVIGHEGCRGTRRSRAGRTPRRRGSGSRVGLADVPVAVGVYRDFPTINRTVDQLAKGTFYHARELNERFTTVFT